ncbi:hypothetical protein ACQRWP_11890 [Micromonospora trifolii]|uniref:hypothetical protein n=1 Tax=Micromonospora trifolii TaxID=2911208 RepID=UPI003D2E9DD9
MSFIFAEATAVGLVVSEQRARERAEQAKRGRLIAVTTTIAQVGLRWFGALFPGSVLRTLVAVTTPGGRPRRSTNGD